MSASSGPARLDAGYDCLHGGGEMGAYMRSFDWSKSPLGPVAGWPQSLRTSVSTCLNSRFAIVIWWGPELVMLYNDSYRQIIGAKHPAALGHPGRECWPEIWHIISPMLEGVMQRGEATWSNDLLLLLERDGYPEECYFTFSYRAIRDESGGIGGVFTPVADTTERVINERRMATLRDLAMRTSSIRDIRQACGTIAETLLENPYSIPFASLYLFDESHSWATLAATAGIVPGAPAAPPMMQLSALPQALREAVPAPRLTVLEDLADTFGPLPRGGWAIPARSGVVLPILMPGQTTSIGFVLAGANPHKRLDENYLTFFDLAGRQISGAIAAAREYELERSRSEALAEIDRSKTVFFSNVSHEFRTPLTLMLGPIEAMLERAPDLDREELQLVHRNGLRLLKLVNTLLDFSRIEAGRVQALYEPTDLGPFTAEIASAFRSTMDRAGLEFLIDCPSLPEAAYVDRDMWEKIVLNLISNAFKFTFSGSIAVRLSGAGERFELSVADTGAGIPEPELPHIFDRFRRVEGAPGRSHEGSGIGLAFVQEMAKLHSGTIRVESALGKGSIFILAIPKGRTHLPPEKLGTERTTTLTGSIATTYVEEAMRWLPDGTPQAAGPFAADSVLAPHSGAVAGRILLADDNADMRLYVRRLLGANYQVESVSNGQEALEAARGNQPDLILTDAMMPALDGFGLLRELRADRSTSTIPVILLSARAGEDARVEGLEAGADDYIVKPFTARELLARVSSHLAMSRLRRETAERERSLREDAEAAHERVANILESISDAFLAIDSEWRFTYVNAAAERALRSPRGELLGCVLWDVNPAVRGTHLEAQLQSAMAKRHPAQAEYKDIWGQWLEIRIYPGIGGGLSVFFQDVSDRKQIEEEIRRNNHALKSANEDLNQFAYSMSHDLREPLRTVMSFCELLHRKYTSKFAPEADEMIGFCLNAARRMDLLISDLLAYMQATAAEETVETVAIESAIQASLLNLQTAIAESSAKITCDPMPVVHMARVHAYQIFQNLIGNALKYRGAVPPNVHVGARKEGGDWIFSVEDNGIGIQPEYQSQVFGLFKRLHADSNRAGTGIGLALCKKLVERYGGRIWVDSEPGNGSNFQFTIPAAGAV